MIPQGNSPKAVVGIVRIRDTTINFHRITVTEQSTSEYVTLIVDECCIFQRVVYLNIDSSVPVQIRAANGGNLLDLYVRRFLTLI